VITIGIAVANDREREKLREDLVQTHAVRVLFACAMGEDGVQQFHKHAPELLLTDLQLTDSMSGIEMVLTIRKEVSRQPFICRASAVGENDWTAFLKAEIRTNYSLVCKECFATSSALLPLFDAVLCGKVLISEPIKAQLDAAQTAQKTSPLKLLNAEEQAVVTLLAQGQSNAQIARELGYHDERVISRINGRIYSCWGLNCERRIARLRAALIYLTGQLQQWNDG